MIKQIMKSKKTETDLGEIKNMAKIFLYQPIKVDDNIPPELCVYHPFLSSSFVCVNSEFTNILNDEEALKKYRELIEYEIDKSNLHKIYILIRKPYRLAFIKHCEPYLSEEDLAELFADAWVSSENPNQDVNCSLSYLIKVFRKCNKHYLMQEEDYEVYKSLPDTFTIYRGVAVNRNPKGLSWTQNLETAKWFAHRFDTEKDKGYIQTAIAKKENVLAYFNTRNEDEIVYDSKKLEISILEEV